MANRKRELAIVTEMEEFEVWAKDDILDQIRGIKGVADFASAIPSGYYNTHASFVIDPRYDRGEVLDEINALARDYRKEGLLPNIASIGEIVE